MQSLNHHALASMIICSTNNTMPVDIYFALKEDALPVTLAEAQKRFVDAGLPCTLEPDSQSPDMPWLVFPNRATDICVTVKDGNLVFATIQAAFDEDPEFVERIARVLEDIGLDAGDPEM